MCTKCDTLPFESLQLKWAKFGKQILAMRDEPNVDLRC